MRVLVTGASGFIGSHLCRALMDAGHEVTAALRREFVGGLPHGVLPITVGEVGPDTDWGAAFDGVECIAHTVARTHVLNDTAPDAENLYRLVNVDGMTHLASQAAAVGVRRFLLLSSIKVCGESSPPGRPLGPADPMAPEDAYGRSKRDAELALWRIAESSGMTATVLRPPLVYGPGLKGNLLRLFKAIDKGAPLPLRSVRNKRSLVYVGNLVDAMVRLLDAESLAGQTFHVCDGDDASTRELIERIAVALGKPARLAPVPTGLLFLAGRLTGRTEMVKRITGSLQINGEAFKQAVGWAPPFTMKEGLALTAAWYKSQGSHGNPQGTD